MKYIQKLSIGFAIIMVGIYYYLSMVSSMLPAETVILISASISIICLPYIFNLYSLVGSALLGFIVAISCIIGVLDGCAFSVCFGLLPLLASTFTLASWTTPTDNDVKSLSYTVISIIAGVFILDNLLPLAIVTVAGLIPILVTRLTDVRGCIKMVKVYLIPATVLLLAVCVIEYTFFVAPTLLDVTIDLIGFSSLGLGAITTYGTALCTITNRVKQ